jgi:hypothetical protein
MTFIVCHNNTAIEDSFILISQIDVSFIPSLSDNLLWKQATAKAIQVESISEHCHAPPNQAKWKSRVFQYRPT